MSRPCPVPGCDLTATEWSVCRSCASRLSRELAAVPHLAAQTELTITRQTACGGPYGARSTSPSLCYDPRASAALGTLKAVLVAWVRDLAEDDPSMVWPADTVAGCSSWLLERVPVLRTHPAGGDAAIEVHRATGACWRSIDRAPERWFAGLCEACGAPMYARPDATTMSCPACRLTYDVAQRRAFLLEAARDYLLTIPELLRALPGWTGCELNDATLRQWRHRGRLIPHGRAAGRDTFRIGDVLDLLTP